MTGEDRPQFIGAVGASLLLHLVSLGFFWKVHITAPSFQDPSPLVVRLVPSTLIPRFIDQPDALPADRPVKSRDISQVTSQARGPGKSPGPVTSPESLGTPHLPQSSRPLQIAKAVPPAPPAVRPKPTAKPTAPVPPVPPAPEARDVSPPVSSASPSETPVNPSKPPPDIILESPETRPPSSSVTAPLSLPSFREQIAALGKERLFEKETDFDPGQIGNTGTGERTISLETESAEFAPYLATVKHRIEGHWRVPRYAREVGLTGRLVLLISITREGKLARLQVNKSSGVSILDDAAVDAVTAGAPYDPFPPHFTYRQLNIVANFEYVTRAAPVYPSR